MSDAPPTFHHHRLPPRIGSALLSLALGLGCARFGFEYQSSGDELAPGVSDPDAPGSGLPDAGAWVSLLSRNELAADAGDVDARSVQPPPADHAPPVLGPCLAVAGAWTLSEPERLDAISTPERDAAPSLSPDGLTLWVVQSTADFQHESYRYVRAALDQPFGVGTPESFNSADSELRLSVLSDGLTAVLNREISDANLYWATRSDPSQDWIVGAALDELNTSAHEWDPWVSPDGLRIYYTSSDAASVAVGGKDILVASRASTSDPFGAPAALAGISTTANEDNPALSNDERFIFFGRMDGFDGQIYWAERTGVAEPFGRVSEAPVINLPANDTEPYLSPDGCELYFCSNRMGGQGGLDLYRSRVIAEVP